MNLHINMIFFFPLGVLLTLRMTLQGINYKTIPLISSSMELVIKILASFVFVPLWGYAGASVADAVFMAAVHAVFAVFLHTDYEKREDLFLKNTGARFVLNLPPAIFYLTIEIYTARSDNVRNLSFPADTLLLPFLSIISASSDFL